MERIVFNKIEKKWQIFGPKRKLKEKSKKFYCLEMFPYPLEKYTWDM